MKLNEIKTLIPEALNTRVNLQWKTQGNIFTTSFELDDRIYKIDIEYFDFSEFEIDNIEKVFEVSFNGKNKNQNNSSYKATGNNTQGGHNLKVFSIVKNSVEDKLKSLDYDIIFFDAKNVDDYYKSCVSLYQKMSSLMKKQLNLNYFNKDYNDFHLFILSKQEIEEDMVNSILKLVANT
jgi:hypothetical protein